MAGFEVYHDKTDLDELLNMDFDEIAEEALKNAAPILEESMKSAIQSSIEHTGDSELVKSIRANKPKKSKNGAWIVNVAPKGYSRVKVYQAKKGKRTYPVSNALKAIWKEYGIAGRQPAKPFLAKATNDAGNEVLNVMQQTFDKKAGG
ncbi:MAG: HK97 gp10 family phage protein [Lachnospiraceae bacterium]|nr:HK97 gp10 family phage protein [Lachnospiraceae bacterium]